MDMTPGDNLMHWKINRSMSLLDRPRRQTDYHLLHGSFIINEIDNECERDVCR